MQNTSVLGGGLVISPTIGAHATQLIISGGGNVVSSSVLSKTTTAIVAGSGTVRNISNVFSLLFVGEQCITGVSDLEQEISGIIDLEKDITGIIDSC